MGIDAVLRGESRDDLASVPDSLGILSAAAFGGKFAETQLLRYLDPWGDAIFNQAQAQHLRDDIRRLTDVNAGSPLSQHLVAVASLVEHLADETHSYLWFIGD